MQTCLTLALTSLLFKCWWALCCQLAMGNAVCVLNESWEWLPNTKMFVKLTAHLFPPWGWEASHWPCFAQKLPGRIRPRIPLILWPTWDWCQEHSFPGHPMVLLVCAPLSPGTFFPTLLISGGLMLCRQASPSAACLRIYLFAFNLYCYIVSLVAATCMESWWISPPKAFCSFHSA